MSESQAALIEQMKRDPADFFRLPQDVRSDPHLANNPTAQIAILTAWFKKTKGVDDALMFTISGVLKSVQAIQRELAPRTNSNPYPPGASKKFVMLCDALESQEDDLERFQRRFLRLRD